MILKIINKHFKKEMASLRKFGKNGKVWGKNTKLPVIPSHRDNYFLYSMGSLLDFFSVQRDSLKRHRIVQN